jgi:hypothetical protein
MSRLNRLHKKYHGWDVYIPANAYMTAEFEVGNSNDF